MEAKTNRSLQAQFLLFECLQDVTGSDLLFMMSVQALVVDTTTEEARTRRLTVLDAFLYIGYSLGSKLGVLLKQDFGYTTLFLCNIGLLIITIFYVIFLVREKKTTVGKEKPKPGKKILVSKKTFPQI